MQAAPAGESAALQRRAAELGARAAALKANYDGRTWYRFVAVFFPIPFVIVLLRLQLEYWHYYLAGGAYILFAAALYSYDTRASERVDKAVKEAEQAREQAEAVR